VVDGKILTKLVAYIGDAVDVQCEIFLVYPSGSIANVVLLCAADVLWSLFVVGCQKPKIFLFSFFH